MVYCVWSWGIINTHQSVELGNIVTAHRIDMLFLAQHVHVETRGENILDLILSTEPNMIDAITD